ncbi:hypothetical protein GYMLUDRAFT_146639, partial [Collybiopsis luxurians FD-317 M1]
GRKISLSKDRHGVQLREHADKLGTIDSLISELKTKIDVGLQGMQDVLKQYIAQPLHFDRPQTVSMSYGGNYGRSGANAYSQSKPFTSSANNLVCFFCNEKGHSQRDCQYLNDLLEKGILIKGESGMTMKDGSYVPQGGEGMSKKDKVMKVTTEKGWLKVKGKEQFLF